MKQEDIDEENIEASKIEQNVISWNRDEALKLLNVVKTNLDLDKHLIYVPTSKEPITFFEFCNTYKQNIQYGEGVIPSIQEDFIVVIDDIKIQLKTTVRSRLEDGIRKMLETIKSYELSYSNTLRDLNKLKQEANKMAKDLESQEEIKFTNEQLKQYAELVSKRIDTVVKEFKEDLDRAIQKSKKEFDLKEEEKEEKNNKPKVDIS